MIFLDVEVYIRAWLVAVLIYGASGFYPWIRYCDQGYVRYYSHTSKIGAETHSKPLSSHDVRPQSRSTVSQISRTETASPFWLLFCHQSPHHVHPAATTLPHRIKSPSKPTQSLRQHQKRPLNAQKPRQRPPLLDLPVAILQTIQNLLPLASAVSLALTHRHLLQTLGTKSIHAINLPAHASQRTDFLLLSLQPDLPA